MQTERKRSGEKGRKTKSEEHSTILASVLLNSVKMKTIRLDLQLSSANSTWKITTATQQKVPRSINYCKT